MGVAEILAIIGALPLLFSLIQSIVTGIENAVNQAKANGTITEVAGPDKLAGALALFQQIWPMISSTGTGAKLAAATTPEQLSQLVTTLINGTVSFFNQVGIFAKSIGAITPTPIVPTA